MRFALARVLGLVGALATAACGPQVALESGTDASSSGSGSDSTGAPAATDSTGVAETNGEVDVGADTCLGECGVECFSDADCGAGAVCTEFNACEDLPELSECPPENLHTPSQLSTEAIVDLVFADDGGTPVLVALAAPSTIEIHRASDGGMFESYDTSDAGVPTQLTAGDLDGNGRLDVIYAVGSELHVMLGDPMGGLLPPMTASTMSPPALQMGFGIVNEDDPNPDVVLAALEPEPTLVVERGNGMGGLFFGTPTVLAQPAEVGDRFAFSPRTLGGMRAVAAGQGEVRRFGSTDGFMTSFYEDNPMRIGNTFVRELATDVSVRTFGSEDQETVMGIVNLSGWTVIARAEFDGAAADQVERWGLPEPSRRVVTNAFGSFDYVLGTDAAKVLVVRGDCYDAYELDAPANEIVIGDYDGRGGLDVAVGSDGGLTLLLTGI